jgi:purine-cytosine permease-like protein
VDDSIGWSLLRTIGPRIPFYLVLIVGLLLAMTRGKRHPTASLWALLGCGLWLTVSLVMAVYYTFLPRLVSREGGMTASEISTIYLVTDIVGALLYAVALGMLVAAIFSNRRPNHYDPY